jgi:hypothetical protein
MLSCRFELRYKQAVTTSDNFLGMSGKDPSSSCCEELLVVLQLPRAKSAAGVCKRGQALNQHSLIAGCTMHSSGGLPHHKAWHKTE